MNYKDEVKKILDAHAKMSRWEQMKALGYSASRNPISTFQLTKFAFYDQWKNQ